MFWGGKELVAALSLVLSTNMERKTHEVTQAFTPWLHCYYIVSVHWYMNIGSLSSLKTAS